MLGQLQLLEFLGGIDRYDVLCRLVREQGKGDRDEAAHYQCIAVADEAELRFGFLAVGDEGLQPYLAGAALNLVPGGAEAFSEFGQLAAELDDIFVPVLPFIENGKILFDLLYRWNG